MSIEAASNDTTGQEVRGCFRPSFRWFTLLLLFALIAWRLGRTQQIYSSGLDLETAEFGGRPSSSSSRDRNQRLQVEVRRLAVHLQAEWYSKNLPSIVPSPSILAAYADVSQRFGENKSMLVNLHLTHHAGTTVCKWALMHSPASHLNAACMIEAEATQVPPTECVTGMRGGACLTPSAVPWIQCGAVCLHAAGLTRSISPQILHTVKYVSYEFSQQPPPQFRLADGDWESEQIISVLVIRDPIERLLAGDGDAIRSYGDPRSKAGRTAAQWWAYANDDRFTRNFQSRILSGNASGPQALQLSKDFIRRITFVLDQTCLNENLEMLGRLLGWGTEVHTGRPAARDSAAVQIGNASLLAYLRASNFQDRELYAWAKQRSLVVCEALEGAKQKFQQRQAQQMVQNLTARPVKNESSGLLLEVPSAAPNVEEEHSTALGTASCDSQCRSHGHCCNALQSGCQHPSCQMGCRIAQQTATAADCERVCKQADGNCAFEHRDLVMNLCGRCPKECNGTELDHLCGGSQGGAHGCFLGCSIAFNIYNKI